MTQLSSTYYLKTSKQINFKFNGDQIYLQPEDVLVLCITEDKANEIAKNLSKTPLSLERITFVESTEDASESDMLSIALSNSSGARDDFKDAVLEKLTKVRLQIITGRDTHTDRLQFIVLKHIARQALEGQYPDVSDKLLPDIMQRVKRELII